MPSFEITSGHEDLVSEQPPAAVSIEIRRQYQSGVHITLWNSVCAVECARFQCCWVSAGHTMSVHRLRYAGVALSEDHLWT